MAWLQRIFTRMSGSARQIEPPRIDHPLLADKAYLLGVPEIENEFGYTTITGRIRFLKDFDYASMRLRLFDSDNNYYAQSLDSIRNIKIGDTWKFRAVARAGETKSFELGEFTAN